MSRPGIGARHDARLLLLAGLLSGVVVALAFAIHGGRLGPGSIDHRAYSQIHRFALAHVGVKEAARRITTLGSEPVADALVIVAAVVLWFHRHRWAAVFVLTVRLAAQLAGSLLKAAVERPRPAFAHAAGFSFPSGHAVDVMSSWLPIAVVVVALAASSRVRWIVAACAAVVCLLVGLSRVLLGAHYPSDILAGYCVGAAICALGWYLVGTAEPAPRQAANSAIGRQQTNAEKTGITSCQQN
jgi:membrane-associated phospholipid phosphatase